MKYLGIAALCLLSGLAQGTHLRSGYITVVPTNCEQTYTITLNIYLNTNPAETDVKFGGGILNFGDGNTHTTPDRVSVPVPGLDFVGLVQYSINYTFSAAGRYLISYREANRNADIINIANSVSIPFYIETSVLIDPIAGCLSTPVFIAPPVFEAVRGTMVSYSFAAASTENLILDYSLVDPMGDSFPEGEIAYTMPEHVSTNPHNGLFTWDTEADLPLWEGEYVFTIKVRSWKRNDDGSLQLIGYVKLDTQIILVESSVNPGLIPKEDIEENGRVHLPTGETKSLRFFIEATGASADLEAYSELSENEEVFSFITYDSSLIPSIKVGVLTLHSTAAIDREEPYIITIRGIQKPSHFSTDINYMLYTRDVYPEVITRARGEQFTIVAYPNPATDWLMLNIPNEAVSQTQLMNIGGQPIRSWENANRLYLADLPSGLYVLRVSLPGQTKTLKVVKR